MRCKAHVLERIRGLETVETAAHYDTDPGIRSGGLDGVQVFDGAVDVAVRLLVALDRRHEGIGTGGEDEGVVVNAPTLVGVDGVRFAVDLDDALADVNRRTRRRFLQCEVVGTAAREILAKVYAIIGPARFLAEHGNRHARNGSGESHEAMADHAISNHDDVSVGIGAALCCCVHAEP